MATTYLSMQTEVAAIGPFSTTTATTGRIKLWLNQSQQWFLGGRRWSFLEASQTVASVSGQAPYTLVGASAIVTDFAQLIDVQHNLANASANFAKLRYLKQQDFDDMFAITGATPGPPIFYTIRGGTPVSSSASVVPGGLQQLVVWPVPNYIGSFKLSFFRNAASIAMTADSDLSLVPDEYVNALIWKAAAIGLTGKGQMIQAGQLEQMASEIRAQAVAADSIARNGDFPPEDQPTTPPSIPPNPAAGANPQNSPYGVRAA
jgi:hypothetical protein